jgi:gamma-glutamyltranspeptidase/glutathione hydrolase
MVYGSKAAAAGLGFLYNNYMGALELENPAHPYYLRPNAVPWSTAAPTIVFRNKEPWLALGSPGSERIFSSISQFLVGVVDRSASLLEAMLEPRFHCSVGGVISLETERFDPQVVDHLVSLGYRIDAREPFSFYLGCIQAVLRRQTGLGFQGVADVRRDGTAGGPD